MTTLALKIPYIPVKPELSIWKIRVSSTSTKQLGMCSHLNKKFLFIVILWLFISVLYPPHFSGLDLDEYFEIAVAIFVKYITVNISLSYANNTSKVDLYYWFLSKFFFSKSIAVPVYLV